LHSKIKYSFASGVIAELESAFRETIPGSFTSKPHPNISGGHSDICSGAAPGSQELIADIKPAAANFGGSLNAMTCYLIERNLKTLGVRVEKQNMCLRCITKPAKYFRKGRI